MRRSTALAGVAFAVAAGGLLAPAAGVAAEAREYIVVYEKGASADAAAKAIEAAGGRIVKANEEVGVATVRSSDSSFAEDVTAAKAIDSAAANRSIGTAEAARKQKTDAVESEGSTAAQAAVLPPVTGGDPLSGEQWDMAAIGATPSGSYASQPGSRAVRVGILDTGVDGSHPDIAPNFNAALSRNFTEDDPVIDGDCADDPDGSCLDPSDVDEDGHGTHVASTIGSPVNGIGMAGVAPGVELVNLRAGQDSGYFFVQATVDALTYAGDHGIDVVNMSYYIDPWLFNCEGAPEDSPAERREQKAVISATQRALDYAHDHGVTLISAEGNGNSDLTKVTADASSPDYPGGTEHDRTIDPATCLSMPTQGDGVVGVTATGKTGRKAFYSDYGNGDADIAAPGGDSREFFGTAQYNAQSNKILAAFPEQLGRTTDTNLDGKLDIDAAGNPTSPQFVKDTVNGVSAYYQYIQGTSMASPHAAGVAALIVAARGVPDPANGGLTLPPATVEQVLAQTATDVPCPVPATFVYPFQGKIADTTDYTATCEGTTAKNGFFGEGLINAIAAGTPAPVAPAPPKAPAPAPPAPPAPAPNLVVVLPRFANAFTVGPTTRIRRLAATAAPGAKITVTCKGGGCPRGFVDYRVGASGTRNLAPRFAGRRLRPGARITILVKTPGIKDRRVVLRIRSGQAPVVTRAIG